jgi:hypothetical protein
MVRIELPANTVASFVAPSSYDTYESLQASQPRYLRRPRLMQESKRAAGSVEPLLDLVTPHRALDGGVIDPRNAIFGAPGRDS